MKYDHIIIQNIDRGTPKYGQNMYINVRSMRKKYYTYDCRKYIPYKNEDDNRVYNRVNV